MRPRALAPLMPSTALSVSSDEVSTATCPDWRHRIIARYYRAREHPSRLRLLALVKRLLGVSLVRATIAPGIVMELDDSDYVQREILFHGGYELATLARFDLLLSEARGCTDLGAHIGLFALRAARVLASRGGRVFCVEPTPTHAHRLLQNAALSGLKNLELCTAAISDLHCIARMISPHAANTGGSRLAGDGSGDLRSIPLHVPVLPAAELAALIPPECLDLVKIDVEGYEFRVLRSLLADIPCLPRNILLEYRPAEFDYGPPGTNIEWLESLGYELNAVDGVLFDRDRPLLEHNLWARLSV